MKHHMKVTFVKVYKNITTKRFWGILGEFSVNFQQTVRCHYLNEMQKILGLRSRSFTFQNMMGLSGSG